VQIKIEKTSSTRLNTVLIDGIDFGDFDELDKGIFSYFPKKQDRLTGDHYIEIGKALNKLNKHRHNIFIVQTSVSMSLEK